MQALGYAIERKRDDFELAGIGASAIRKFSRRTDKIEEEAKKRGIEDPEEKARLGGLTRERKDKSLTWQELRAEWDNWLTPQERAAIAAVQEGRGASIVPEWRDAAAVDFAVRHEFAKEAVVPERKLLTTALKQGLGSVTVEGVRREYGRVPLLVEEHGGRRVATTGHVLEEEERLVDFARDGRGTCRPLAPDRAIQRDWLNAGQRRAVEHVLRSRDRVTLIRGAAGTGKTTLMQEAVEAIEQAGHRVVMLAPSATAARDVLREHFASADTVAMFLRNREMQADAAGGVIWVDEASLLDSPTMAALFDVAEQQHARLVLMGDRRQHSSPSRGSPLRLLQEEAGVPVVEVSEIMRQQGDYKKAVQLLSEGKTEEGFDELDRLGWVQEVPDAERYLRLAEAYLAASAERKADGSLKRALVVSPTHSEGQRITAVIRGELAAEGQAGTRARVPLLRAAAPDGSGAGRGEQLPAWRYGAVPSECEGV